MNLKIFFKKIRVDRKPSREFHVGLKASLAAYIKSNPFLPAVTPVAQRDPAFFWKKGLTISLATLLILCAGATGTVFAAQRALPGDALYGVKLAVSQLSIAITNSPAVRLSVANQRLQEVKQVLAAQPNQNAQTQKDIANALQQYQNNIQVTAGDINAKNVAPSTVQVIIQKTAEGQYAIEQMPSRNATGTVAQAAVTVAKTIFVGDSHEKAMPSGSDDSHTDRLATSTTTLATPTSVATLAETSTPMFLHDEDPEQLPERITTASPSMAISPTVASDTYPSSSTHAQIVQAHDSPPPAATTGTAPIATTTVGATTSVEASSSPSYGENWQPETSTQQKSDNGGGDQKIIINPEKISKTSSGGNDD
jgi:hypothetical protein